MRTGWSGVRCGVAGRGSHRRGLGHTHRGGGASPQAALFGGKVFRSLARDTVSEVIPAIGVGGSHRQVSQIYFGSKTKTISATQQISSAKHCFIIIAVCFFVLQLPGWKQHATQFFAVGFSFVVSFSFFLIHFTFRFHFCFTTGTVSLACEFISKQKCCVYSGLER